MTYQDFFIMILNGDTDIFVVNNNFYKFYNPTLNESYDFYIKENKSGVIILDPDYVYDSLEGGKVNMKVTYSKFIDVLPENVTNIVEYVKLCKI